MDIEKIRSYCLSKIHTSEGLPFDEDTLVFYVANKMFALTSLEKTPLSINLKCDPEWAQELRENYEEIEPGYHMNKKHWNTVYPEKLDSAFVFKLIDHSYELVVRGLTKKTRNDLGL